jgi:ABC-type multidrug transport system fused ATPase/permease subunit
MKSSRRYPTNTHDI